MPKNIQTAVGYLKNQKKMRLLFDCGYPTVKESWFKEYDLTSTGMPKKPYLLTCQRQEVMRATLNVLSMLTMLGIRKIVVVKQEY